MSIDSNLRFSICPTSCLYGCANCSAPHNGDVTLKKDKRKITLKKLTNRIKELAGCLGAADLGIVTQKLLEGGPPSKDIRKKRYRMLTGSGIVVQHPGGSREPLSPGEAKERLAAMPEDVRILYEPVG